MNPALTAITLNPVAFNPDIQDGVIKMESIEDGNNVGEEAPRKPWMKRPGAPVTKIAPEVKRRRKNYQARKLLSPKNPLMILNELKPNVSFTFEEKPFELSNGQPLFIATVEIDGQKFSGKGANKKQAQQDAAETALRGIYFERLLEQLVRKEDGESDAKDTNQSSEGPAEGAPPIPEDDTPWSGLASLAMYKLASLWQIPTKQALLNAPKLPCVPGVTVNPTIPLLPLGDLKSKLPVNAHEIDPVMLLNQISPQSKFNEMSRDVRNGNTVFTLTTEFNGQVFSGSATKKRFAKKLCAKAALKSLGVEYVGDVPAM